MEGTLDYINKESIGGWVFGDVKNIRLKVDGKEIHNLNVNSVQRGDVEKVYPGKKCSGFEIFAPKIISNGEVHQIELFVNKTPLEHTPKEFRYVDNRPFFHVSIRSLCCYRPLCAVPRTHHLEPPGALFTTSCPTLLSGSLCCLS